MGYNVPSEVDYTRAWKARGVTTKKKSHVTAAAEQQAHSMGQLSSVVNPAYDSIRRSLMRFDAITLPDGTKAWQVTVGPPMSVESLNDTTGSMGDNVDLASENLPRTMGMMQRVLPGFDLQYALGYFGDAYADKFPFQRGQFEMTADKLVNTLVNMVPERNGGDYTEDPHYGVFGAAYLTSAYLHRIGLKGYHFTVSDAPTRTRFSMSKLKQIFGEDVLEKLVENGRFAQLPPNISSEEMRSTLQSQIEYLSFKEVVSDLLKISHAFYLHVTDGGNVPDEWREAYGDERIIKISSTKYQPQVQSAIVGLTEGTLDLQTVVEFLDENGMPKREIERVMYCLRKIPLRAQAKLYEQLEHPLPKPGDIFLNKTDLWPMSSVEAVVRERGETMDTTADDRVVWL